MISENRALWLARNYALSCYNHCAVIMTSKASSFQNGSQIFLCFGVRNWSIILFSWIIINVIILKQLVLTINRRFLFNRPLPSSKNPHFQKEARCTNFLVKMSFICIRMTEMISISKAEHLPSFWNRGPGELGSGLLNKYPTRVPTRNSSSNSSFGLKRPPTLFHGFSMSFIQITWVFSGKIRYICGLLKHLTLIVNPQPEYYSNQTYFPGAWKIL